MRFPDFLTILTTSKLVGVFLANSSQWSLRCPTVKVSEGCFVCWSLCPTVWRGAEEEAEILPAHTPLSQYQQSDTGGDSS